MTRKYEAVKPTTRTEQEIEAAKAYWIKRHNELAIAIGISAARLIQLGIPIPLQEINPDQLRIDVV